MRSGFLVRGVLASTFIVILSPGLGCPAPSDQPPAPPPSQTIDDLGEATAAALAGWLPDQLKAKEVPGAAAVVVGKEAVIWEEVFGVTGGPDSSPVTPDTMFCIRSVSKSVTALAVLMLVQDGLVDLDVPVVDYLPDFTVNSRFDDSPEKLITLRGMLSHWAGFSHDPPQDLDLSDPAYFDRYVEWISDSWLRFPVGYRFEYANLGIDLAAVVIRTRSGLPFAEYVRRKVLEPLGMTRSTFDLWLVEQDRERAIGHDSEGNVVPVHFPEIAAAGLYSSIRDMARYARFHLNGGFVNGRRLLREDLMNEYHSIQFAARDQRSGYCLGLNREVVSNTFYLYHEGGGRGFGSHLILHPNLGFAYVVLTNREYHGLTGYQARRRMNGVLVNRFGPESVAESRTGAMRKLDSENPRVESILGRYGDSPGYVVGFENGILGLRMDENQFLPMVFYDDDGQLVGVYDATRELRFLPPYAGRPGAMMTVNRVYSNSNLHYRDFNDSLHDPAGPDKPEWRPYLGEYEVLWDDIAYDEATVTVKNGHLYYRDGRCEEHEPGMFFRYDGAVLDFRATPPTFANSELRKK